MQKVVIVKEGELKKGSYDLWVTLLKRMMDGLAEVEVAETFDDALVIMGKSEVDALIFISRSMIPRAREIKKERSRLKVVLFSGLIPDDEIILIDKAWGLSHEALRKIIL